MILLRFIHNLALTAFAFTFSALAFGIIAALEVLVIVAGIWLYWQFILEVLRIPWWCWPMIPLALWLHMCWEWARDEERRSHANAWGGMENG